MPTWWNSIDVLSRLSTTTQLVCAALLVLTALVGLFTIAVSNRLVALKAESERAAHERLRLTQAALERLQTAPAQVPAPVPAPAAAAPEEPRQAPKVTPRPIPPGPRQLTTEQRRQFVSFIKGKARGRVGLLTVMGDTEARRFAGEMERLLREAGLETDGVTQAVFPRGVPRGLILRLRNAQAAPAHAASLQQALQHIGLSAPGVASVQEPPHSVTLIVGAKPGTKGRTSRPKTGDEGEGEGEGVQTQPLERLIDEIRQAEVVSSVEEETSAEEAEPREEP